MNKVQIRKALDEYASRNTPADADLWPSVLGRLKVEGSARAVVTSDVPETGIGSQSRQLDRPWDEKRPAFSVSLAMVLVLSIGLAALILGPLSGRGGGVFGNNVGAEPGAARPMAAATVSPASIEDKPDVTGKHMRLEHVERLGTELNLSRSIGAYSVTLRRAYADANHVVVVYSVEGPPRERIAATNNVLSNTGGVALPPLFGHGDKYVTASLPREYVMAFDAGGLESLPQQLQLSMSLDLVRIEEEGLEPPVAPSKDSGKPYGNADQEKGEAAGLPEANRWENVAGPFTLDFTLSVTTEGTRVVEVNQTVTASDMPMTLERVIVTPGEARAVLRFTPPESGELPWKRKAIVSLAAGDFSSESEEGLALTQILRPASEDRWHYGIVTSLVDRPGEWTLTVKWLEPANLPADASDPTKGKELSSSPPEEVWYSPWVFRFTVPGQPK